MEFYRIYWREVRLPVLTGALFALIFAVSFLLYHLPLMAVAYPALLCAALGAALLWRDMTEKRRRYRELSGMRDLEAAEIRLPEPAGTAEAGCQSVIRALCETSSRRDSEAAARFRDTVEYYTAWAHQIKTPITAMNLALENEDTPLARRLRAGLLQIEQYVGMVLTYLRLDSESTDYVFREQPLDDIVTAALARFAPEFLDRRLTLDYTPSGLTVVTDEKWLPFAFGQVLSNALKHTREGGIRVYSEAPKTLCVADTGIGIDPADLPRIFEKGYTGCNGRRDNRASGIGLYLTRRVCDRLGVQIKVNSAPGKGTTVRLDLSQYELKAE